MKTLSDILYSKEFASGKGHIAKGIIYIEHGDYAIHKMEYTTYEPSGSKEKTLYDIQVEYIRSGASMHLNYLSFNNFVTLKDPLDFEVREMAFDKDMMAMEIILNKPPSAESVSDAGNYEIIYQGKKMVITKVRTGHTLHGEPANSVYLYVHSFLFPRILMHGVFGKFKE